MIALTQHWIGARVRLTLRNSRAVTFTFAFPLVLLVLLSALHGNAEVTAYGQPVRLAQFYAPSIAVFSLVTACYTSLVMGLAHARDDGLFKRVRSTPLPMAVYLGAWVAAAVAVGLGGVALLFAVAVPAFDVRVYAAGVPAAVVTLVLGALCLAAVGVAVASLVGRAEQAMPVVQLTFLPLSFLSGIWFPLDGAPDWLASIAHLFPLYHLAQAFGAAFTPHGGWEPGHLLALAAWTAAAVLVAVRRLRFAP